MSTTLVYDWLKHEYILFIVTDAAHQPRQLQQPPAQLAAYNARLFAPDVAQRADEIFTRPYHLTIEIRRQIAAELDARTVVRPDPLHRIECEARAAAENAERERRRAIDRGDADAMCTPSRNMMTGGR